MPEQKIQVSRAKVGLLCLICLTSAAAIFFFAPHSDQTDIWQAAFTRVGLVLGAFWIALPSGKRPAAWANVSPTTFFGMLMGVFVLGRYPRAGIVIIIVVAVLSFVLRPRPKKRPGEG
ncbi:MAG: hypothetical protein CMJ78_12955 [Planctomycetaceae bacterium]|nr:hypothetical protein [Planctomycetaceae bacterium]